MKFSRRSQLVKSFADLLRVNLQAIGAQITQCTGKPIRESLKEVQKSISACEYFAGSAEEFLEESKCHENDCHTYIRHRPFGRILVISPWNYPVWQVIRSTIPAILSGNQVALKPSPVVDKCTQPLIGLLREAGFGDEVLEVLPSSKEGFEDSCDPTRYNAVFFTGSTRSGRKVATWAGQNLIKSVIELGGSDPYIVLRDADLDLAAEACVKSRFMNAGQRCNAAKRLIVESSIADVFTRKLLALTSRLKVGDPLDPDTQMGPLISCAARDFLHNQVQDSVFMGARVLHGGQIPKSEGAFYPPTVLADVQPGMPVFDEETFGPVAPIITVDNIDEAIRFANHSQYGLGAAVFTADTDVAIQVGERLVCGSFAINRMLETDFRFPFGGTKSSGYGRELGRHGFLESCYVRTEYRAQ